MTESNKCAICNKTYKNTSGLKNHQTKCKDNIKTNSQNNTSESANNNDCTIEHQITIHTWLTEYIIKSFSGVKIFTFYPPVWLVKSV